MMTVLHLHVPRTGGISVARALTAALGDREVLRTKKPSDVTAALQRGADVGLVSGHFPWGLHELFADSLYFIVLRDPVERVRSLYDYIRAVPVHRHHKRFSSNTLETLLKQAQVRTYLSNGQVRQIGALQPGTEKMSEAVLARAWGNICRDDVVVGFTDRIGEGLDRLAARVGRSIPTPRKAMNRVPRSGLDDQVIEDLRRLNELDIELYRRARARFAPTTPSFGR